MLFTDRVKGGALISTGLTILSVYSFLIFAVPFFEQNHPLRSYVPGPLYLFGIPALIFSFSFVYATFFVGYCLNRGETPF